MSKGERYKAQVPSAIEFVDESQEHIEKQVNQFSGEGLVASHGDICNATWIFASDGKIYLIDFDMLKTDDPAADLGALLWWYYPPELRESFLEMAGYRYDDAFKLRMQIRMAMHTVLVFSCQERIVLTNSSLKVFVSPCGILGRHWMEKRIQKGISDWRVGRNERRHLAGRFDQCVTMVKTIGNHD